MESRRYLSRIRSYEDGEIIKIIKNDLESYNSNADIDCILRGIDQLPKYITVEKGEDHEDYNFIIIKTENSGHSDAFKALYARKGEISYSKVNYLFMVSGNSYKDVSDRFLMVFNRLSKNIIRGKKWSSQIKNIDFSETL